MPIRRRPTLPFKAGYARGRGEAAVRTREMKFKVAFEDVRAQRRLQEIGAQFQAAQKRMEMAAAIEKKRQQDRAGAEALGMEAARRGEDVDFKDPHSALAYEETRRQMGAPERAAEARRKTLAEQFGREGIITVGGKRYRRPPADVGALMRQASGGMRDYILARGTPKTPEEFHKRAMEYEKQVWTQTQAKTRNEAMRDAEEAFLVIRDRVFTKTGYDQFDAIERELGDMGFSKEEIASIAEKKYEWGRPGPNKYTDIRWNRLRQMLFQKRAARMGVSARPREEETSKTGAFLDAVEE